MPLSGNCSPQQAQASAAAMASAAPSNNSAASRATRRWQTRNIQENHPEHPFASRDDDEQAVLETLLARVARSEESALSEFYQRTKGTVFGIALSVLQNYHDAEEATCDVYTQVWRIAINYKPTRGAVLAWLITITRSRAHDRLRRNHRSQRLLETMQVERTPIESTSPMEQARIVGESQQHARTLLEGLTPAQQQVLSLAYFAELSTAEISARLSMPMGTVKSHIRRGLARLREQVQTSNSIPD